MEHNKFYLYELLARTRDAANKAINKEMTKIKILPKQAAILRILDTSNRSFTTIELAQLLIHEKHSTNEILIRMEKRGLIKRTKDSPTGLYHINITAKGRKISQLTAESKTVDELMSTLTEEEQDQLYNCLIKVWKKSLEMMEKDEDTYPMPVIDKLPKSDKSKYIEAIRKVEV